MDVVICSLIYSDTKKSTDSCHRPHYLSPSRHPASRTLILAWKLEQQDSLVHSSSKSGLILTVHYRHYVQYTYHILPTTE